MALTIKQNVAQQIVEAVKDVCSHDINFINSQGIIFASTNTKRIGDFHEIGLQVIKTGETIEVESGEGYLGTKEGVNIPFIYKGDVSAVIGISGSPEEVRKYAYLAQKITTLLLREHELDTLEHTQKTQLNHVMRALIDHNYINPEYLKAFLKKYNAFLDNHYQTIIVKLDTRYNPSNLAMIEQYIYQAFELTGSKLYTFNYSNEYILFLESKKLKQWLYLFEQLSSKHAPLLKIGIGHSTPLSHQHISYQSAKLAINCLLANEHLAIFDNLDISILLGNIADDTKRYYLDKTISNLSDKDLELLETYFFHDMSLKDTCEELYLHKNTLQYKLDRIHKITGYNPRNFKNAVVLYIGLKLLKIEK
jgi:carbohydrate diacid regulator